MDKHEDYMARAVAEAKRGVGLTAPNPPVGALVVKNSTIVGIGFHPKAGEPHAEVFALKAAGEAATGADLYVTLEPCSHFGKTPPCADAVINAGIARVFVGIVDPNPEVAGRGAKRLQEAGIEVQVGLLEDACRELIAPFACYIGKSRPLVTLKAGMTLDGKIATATGESQWITSEESRRDVHRLRAECDAILVGVGTVVADNPRLTVRSIEGRNPIRVVLDSELSIPDSADLLDVTEAATMIITTDRSSQERRASLEERGVEVVVVPRKVDRPDLEATLVELAKHGIMHLLLEGGGEINNSFLQAGLIDRVRLYVAPMILGGDDAMGVFRGAGIEQLSSAFKLKKWSVEQIGIDIVINGEA